MDVPTFYRARGRHFTDTQLERILQIAECHFSEGRTSISVQVCKALRWRQPNGRLKDVACREVLRKLEADGLLSLPKPRGKGGVWLPGPTSTKYSGQTSPVRRLDFPDVELRLVKTGDHVPLWNTLVSTYHYLGSSRIVGRQMKYLAFAKGRPVACVGWGDGCWAVSARDRWIGWSAQQRSRNRHLVINNVRFLILPWVRVPNLASFILARCGEAVLKDWQAAYGFQPVLLETFVDPVRFHGTCYRAANWIEVGTTAGYSKTGSAHHNSQAPKTLFVYPVRRSFRDVLKGSRR